ncbi:DUF805 domain-containing protein [Sphingobium nicotianae]|uniref:DUF805 domain-containing protein n=1 Tax=Sphingobium nicotianae TaxID=2782607 RepID=A0A9X1AIB7_9SPHN|nr:DUF805 domain-containing protein [Sphingobium nicotianae]MBT2185832.1 DUF805 domain-containing protein [Sphingobium nicotianae]
MQTYFAIMRRGFVALLDFRGRAPRRHFWPFALTWVFVMIVSSQLLMRLLMSRGHFGVGASVRDVPLPPGSGGGSVEFDLPTAGDMARIMTGFFYGTVIAAAIFILLVAAITVRRLHDSGRTGAWALPPLVFLASGFAMMASFFTGGSPPMALFPLIFLNNLVYLLCLGYLIYLLCKPSDPDANRFGRPELADL